MRFDGVRFTFFNKSNSPGIITNRFINLYFDILERTAPLAEALGYSDHFLYVGRRAVDNGGFLHLNSKRQT